jgi:predicted outer membrane repeat protein
LDFHGSDFIWTLKGLSDFDNQRIFNLDGTVLLSVENATFTYRNSAFGLNVWNGAGLHFERSSVSFVSNAVIGYSLTALINSSLEFRNSSSVFLRNTAQHLIGANGSRILFEGGLFEFRGNRALDGGGAVYAVNGSDITFKGIIGVMRLNISDISGGAIYALGSNFSFENSHISFSSNTASGFGQTGFAGGGAIYGIDTHFDFRGSTIIFSSNIFNATFALQDFHGGGALALGGASEFNFEDGLLIFSSNAVRGEYGVGGAAAIGRVGRFNVSNSSAEFNSNSASFKGGSIFMGKESALEIEGWISFSKNKVVGQALPFGGGGEGVGGALYISSAAQARILGFGLFEKNAASSSGGFVFADEWSDILFEGGFKFIGNSASVGGAIYASSMSRIALTALGGDIVFEQNTVGIRPNDVYMDWANLDVNANDNQVKMMGGIKAIGGWIDYSNIADGSWLISGINYFEGLADFNSSVLSSITVMNATWTYLFGNRIYLEQSEWHFINSSVTFMGNVDDGGISNDMTLDESSLIIDGGGRRRIVMLSGLRAVNFSRVKYTNGLGGNWLLGGINEFSEVLEFSISARSSVTVLKGSWDYFSSARNISLDAGVFDFIGSTVNFHDNVWVEGSSGAIRLDNGSVLRFSRSSAVFRNNSDSFSGGALFALNGSSIVFSSGSFLFENNLAVRGGSIYLGERSYLNVASASVLFAAGLAQDGGALYADSMVNIRWFGGLVEFADNEVQGFGGSIYLSSGSRLSFANAEVLFENNSALQSGGSIFVSSGSVVSFSSGVVRFSANHAAAAQAGGAIYAAWNSTVSFNAASDIVFEGNISAGGANDVYLEEASLIMRANKNRFIFNGGLIALKSDIDYSNAVGGSLFLSGFNEFRRMNSFKIGVRSVIEVFDSTFSYLSNNFPLTLINQSTIHFRASSITFSGNIGYDLSFNASYLLFNFSEVYFGVGVFGQGSQARWFSSHLVLAGSSVFSAMSAFEASDSLFDVQEARILYENGSTALLSGSTFSFVLSSITFRGNVLDARIVDGGFVFSGSTITFHGGLISTNASFGLEDSEFRIFKRGYFELLGAFNFSRSLGQFERGLFEFVDGLAIANISHSTVEFKNSTFSFASQFAGGILLNWSRLMIYESRGKFSDGLESIGGEVLVRNSRVIFGGRIDVLDNGAFELLGSSVSVFDPEASFSGIGRRIELTDSFLFIIGGGRISLSALSVGGDIVMNAGSKLVLDASEGSHINFDNGLRIGRDAGISGGIVFKRGLGAAVFSGYSDSDIEFLTIESGSAIFNSPVSSVNVLVVNAGSAFDLRGSDLGLVYLESEISVSGVGMGFDFDRSLWSSDYLRIFGDFRIANSSAHANLYGNPPDWVVSGSSIAFIESENTVDIGSLYLVGANRLYRLGSSDNRIWLIFIGGWNAHQRSYARGGGSLNLLVDIQAGDDGVPPNAFASPAPGGVGFVINGWDPTIGEGVIYSMDAFNDDGVKNLGFVFDTGVNLGPLAMGLKDIVFKNFERTNISKSGQGGVVYMRGPDLSVIFIGSVSFFNNSAQRYGGALYIEDGLLDFSSSAVWFFGGRAGNRGGAVAALNSSISFSGARAEFSGNEAGGAPNDFSLINSQIFFSGGESLLGGGFWVDGGSVIFSGGRLRLGGASSFRNNSVLVLESVSGLVEGSLIYGGSERGLGLGIKFSTIEFRALDTDVEGGSFFEIAASSVSLGGAFMFSDSSTNIFVNNSRLRLSGLVDLEGGMAIEGGLGDFEVDMVIGSHLGDGVLSISNAGHMNFKGSTALVNGSFIYIGNKGGLLIVGGGGFSASGDGLISGNDGIMQSGRNRPYEFAQSAAIGVFNSSLSFVGSYEWLGNKVDVAFDGSSLVLGGRIKFGSGLRGSNSWFSHEGGRLELFGLSAFGGMRGFVFSGLDYVLVSGTFSYIGGSSLRAENSVIDFRISSAVFRNIVSTAVIVFNSDISLGSEVSNGVYDFRGNGSDIWLLGDSRLEFASGGGRISFVNGLRVGNTDLVVAQSYFGLGSGGESVYKITKTGLGAVIFSGVRTHLAGGFRIESGSAVFNSPVIEVDDMVVEEGGSLSFLGGGFNTLYAGSVSLDGVWALEVDFAQNRADAIIASNSFSLSGGSRLDIRTIRQGNWVFGSSVVIVVSHGLLDYQEPFYDSSKYMLVESDGKIHLVNAGEIADFRYLVQTHNQQEALKFLEAGVKADRRNSQFYKSGGSDRARKILELYDLIGAATSCSTPDEMRRILDMLSGQFLAQVITRAAFDDPSELLYPRIRRTLASGLKDNKDEGKSIFFHSLWLSGSGRQKTMDGPKYNMGVFEDERYDGFIGFNLLERAGGVVGAYGSFGGQYIQQGSNEAVVENFGGGFYGGLFLGRFEQKGFIGGGWHNISAKRDIDLGSGLSPESHFYLASLKAGFESAYDVSFSSVAPIKTLFFAGMTAWAVYNRDIVEEGMGIANLTIKEGSYERLLSFGGLRFKGKGWHADVKMNYSLLGTGERSRFDVEWNEFNHAMEIDGAPDDLVSFTASFGFEQEIEKDIYFFGGADFTRSRGGYEQAIGGRAGIKYLFPSLGSVKDYKNWMAKTDPERRRIAVEKKTARDLKRREREAARELERQKKEAAAELRMRDKIAAIERLENERRAAQPRMTILSDRSGMELAVEMPPDVAEEERINSRSKTERIVAHVVVVEKSKDGSFQGRAYWKTLVNVDKSAFESENGDLGSELKSDIRKGVGKILGESADIARVRVVRYGPEPNKQELALAELRASKIYDEIERIRKEGEEIREAKARRENAIASYKLKAASFALNSSVLSETAIANIERLSKEIQDKGFNRVTVEGHTDSSGDETINKTLSRQRASAVYTELIKTGIVKEKLYSIGFASNMPISDNATEQGRAANRRVEIFVE